MVGMVNGLVLDGDLPHSTLIFVVVFLEHGGFEFYLDINLSIFF